MSLADLTDDELIALKNGDLSKLSDKALLSLSGREPPKPGLMVNAFGDNWFGRGAQTIHDATTGVGQGASLGANDEIQAGISAIPEAIATGTSVPDAYDKRLAAGRQEVEDAYKRSPIATPVGEFAGGLLTLGQASSANAAKTLGQQIVQGAKAGVPTSAAYGFNTGEGGFWPRAQQGLWGAGLGAGASVAAPLIGAGARAVARPFLRTFQSVRDPTDAAARILSKAADDGTPQLTDAEMLMAKKRGQPVANIERMGQSGQDLARAAANRSGAASETLNEFSDKRIAERGSRLADFYKRYTGGLDDAELARDKLTDEARKDLAPLYSEAYLEGDRPIWTPRLKRLAEAPEFQAAMKDAITEGKNWAVFEGHKFRPTVKLDNDGNFIFRQVDSKGKKVNVPPNLQYWDYVKRSLQGAANKAEARGATDVAMRLRDHARQLADTLSGVSPKYRSALDRGAGIFGGKDAIEDGQKLFAAGNKGTNWRAVARKHATYTPAQKKMFAVGYVDSARRFLEKNADKRTALKHLFGTPDARARAQIALGPSAAKELEAIMHVETAIERLRTSLQGGSNTLKQLAAQGLLVGEGYSFLEGSPIPSMHNLMTGMLVAAAKHGAGRAYGRVNQRVYEKLAEMLVSDDPTVFQRGIKSVANDRRLMGIIRALSTMGTVASGQQSNQDQ